MTRTIDDLYAGSRLDPLSGPDGTAERLVLLVHRGADFDVWGGARRVRYWDALTERVRLATYAGPGLLDWWGSVATLPSEPRSHADREEAAVLLATEPARPVLGALRRHADALVLRARVVVADNRDPDPRPDRNVLPADGPA